MTNVEKKIAVALVEDMVAHGYRLMQYPTAEAMVDYYAALPLEWWQKCHAHYVGA